MVSFPNAKINIGLNIISKRPDGFHNIETIFYPIGLSDVLEIIPDKDHIAIKTSGIALNINAEENICYKAYQLLSKRFNIPPLEIYLHKIIPSGAGLGGGSSDAAFLLKEINSLFKLGIKQNDLESIASDLGSDCAFFIRNKAVFAKGRGEQFEDISLDLSDYYIYLVKPDIFVSTAEAYSLVKPAQPKVSLKDLIKSPVSEWKSKINNDFEFSIFNQYPLLNSIKSEFYKNGALYATMSGSGSAIYGIFPTKPPAIHTLNEHFSWISKL